MEIKRKNKASARFGDIVSIKVTKPFIFSNACTRSKWPSNSEKQKDNSVLWL